MREALAALVRRLSPAATVVELDSMAAITAAAQEHGQPDIICLELLLKDAGVPGIRQTRQQFADASLVVLSSAPARDYEDQAIQAGADVFIHKSSSLTEISSVLRILINAEPESETESSTPPEKLSKRQKQLLGLLDKGMSNRDIAEMLQISEHTVKVHLWRLFRRLNVKSRSQASHLARTTGML